MIRVEGDPMAPTLNAGDDILVDHADPSDGLRDGIYVLRGDDALLVKRLAIHPFGGGSRSSRTIPITPTDPIARWTDSIASAA